MGVVTKTWTGKSSGQAGAQSTQRAPSSPAVVELQRWLSMPAEKSTGVYDKTTMAALVSLRDRLDPQDQKNLQVINVLDNLIEQDIATVRRDPDIIAQVLFRLNQILGPERGQQQSAGRNAFMTVTLPDGQQRPLPLVLLYNRGYTMYQAILEQNGLIDMNMPLDQRLTQLTAVTQSIINSIPKTEYNANILFVITESDKDLRESWRRAERVGVDSANAGTLASALSAYVPEFSKATEAQRAHIINVIYHRFPSADKFMEAPPNINSKVTDIRELRRNQASLTGVVAQELRNMGLKR